MTGKESGECGDARGSPVCLGELIDVLGVRGEEPDAEPPVMVVASRGEGGIRTGDGDGGLLTPFTAGIGVLAGRCSSSMCIDGNRAIIDADGDVGVCGSRRTTGTELPGILVGTDGRLGRPGSGECRSRSSNSSMEGNWVENSEADDR